MPNPADFGTERAPIRMSSLPRLATCTMREFLMYMGDLLDESGAAADTGSMVHGMVAAWHTSGFDASRAAQEVAALQKQFPLADPEIAASHFAGYANDPRNRVHLFGRPERPVRLNLDMGEGQEPLCLVGTLDQIREHDDGNLYVWDVKTGRPSGLQMLDMYALQISGYALAATTEIGRPVLPGGFIRTVGYLEQGRVKSVSPEKVFYEIPWTLKDCELLLDTIRRAVRQIRAGEADFAPGDACKFCPARGFQNCLPLLRKYL